MRFLVSDI